MANCGNMPSYWTLRRKCKAKVARQLELIQSEDTTDFVYSNDCGALQDIVEDENFMDCQSTIDESYIDDTFVDAHMVPDSESDSEASENECTTLQDNLAVWATEHNISHAALNDLLKLLSKHHTSLPKDARTLLGTTRSILVQEKAGGQYHHFGVLNSINGILDENIGLLSENTQVNLQVNIDGLPLFKSSGTQLWPILAMVQNFPHCEPVIIGLFCGTKKPNNLDEFLEEFVAEIVDLERGFQYEGITLKLKLSSIVCDAPACAFLKKIKGHSGYYGCGKCTQEGEYKENRVIFPETNTPLRTDDNFKEMCDEEHHLGPSPLQNTSIGMVSGFPLDYMHLVCLGVMRRLLMLWLRGQLACRLSTFNVSRLSQQPIDVKNFVPVEFSRKPRSLQELDRWKATELRQFLLYTGPVVLKNIVDTAVYNNFLLLFVAIFILSNMSLLDDYLEYSKELLILFVQHFGELYGEQYISYNVHNLVHLPEDARTYGTLDNFSAFKYENFMQKLKKLVRKPEFLLSQIVKRLSERPSCRQKRERLQLIRKHMSGPLPTSLANAQAEQFKEIKTDTFTLKLDMANSLVCIEGSVARVKNIIVSDNETYVAYSEFANQESFFDYPLASNTFGINTVDCLSKSIKVCKLGFIEKKVFLLPFDGKFVAIPLLHCD
ncbi:hypothetical protein AMEX_G13048 [Astyanax mexicanus]|uniref:Transposase domain-containing protein n=1 Tax=Astyanax mexicanus TaxID=7994 RepID=A0A8T2LJ44_ASTMX|nr:hypothetical protein AMEX_G13048 [Astyanax mexicanus]